MGVERLIGLYEACGGSPGTTAPDVYIVAAGDAAFAAGMSVAEQIRDADAGIRVELNLGGGSFKSQLKRADKSGAEFAVILGEDEVARGEAGLKPLRSGGEPQRVSLDKLTESLAAMLANKH